MRTPFLKLARCTTVPTLVMVQLPVDRFDLSLVIVGLMRGLIELVGNSMLCM